MDLWVVAAATGAGYIAKYWQNLSGNKEGLSDSYPGSMYSICKKVESQRLLQAIGGQRKLLGNVYSEKEDDSHGKFQEFGWQTVCSAAELASTSGSDGNISTNPEIYRDYHVHPLSSLPLGLSGTRVFQQNIKGTDDFLHRFGTKESCSSFKISNKRTRKNRRSHLYIVKPLNYSESCLRSRLNEEQRNTDEKACILPPVSTPRVTPLLGTKENRVICRVGRDSYDVEFGSRNDSENQPIGLEGLPRKPARSRSGTFHSQAEPPNGMLLFFLGIGTGIISTMLTNKREVDKLNGRLKQTDNLVQDLHNELRMKERMNVKEIPNGASQSLQIENCISSFKRKNAQSFSDLESQDKFINTNPCDQKLESPDLMSKIEAELEAELQTLELNMKRASFKGISNFVELDPGFKPDVVQGDLKLDEEGADLDDDDASGNHSTHIWSGNYTVPPQELSLRLHELIESRLQARIGELETALQNSHQIMRSLESRNVVSREGFEYSELGSLFTSTPRNFIGEDDNRDQTLLIYAYNETYEEINRAPDTNPTESEDDNEIFAMLEMKQTSYSMGDQMKIQIGN